jgi:tetratricopeptide (TPR) repeat protein
VAFEERDYERARSPAHEARELALGLEPAMSQAPLHMLAQSLRMSGDHEGAAPLFEESLELNRRIHDEGMVFVDLENLGRVEAHRGNMDAAERYLTEAAERADLDDPYNAAMAEFDRALVVFGRGDRDRAAELLLRARSAISDLGVDLPPDDLAEVGWLGRRLGG